MANFFDQFDDAQTINAPSVAIMQQPQKRSNPFDVFDDGARQTPKAPMRPDQDGGRVPLPSDPMPSNQPSSRFGDSLKPYFGGHNPIAETYDNIIKPMTDVSSERPVLDRAVDTVNFSVSAPLKALRLPSIGEAVESVTGNSGIADSERRFVENNPELLRAIGALGEAAAAGSPLGQGARAPAPTQVRTPRAQAIRQQVSDDVVRARNAANDMRSIGVDPYGPAVAAAKRGDNSAGAVTQGLADKPIVGAPLQRGARRFVDDMVQAQEEIRSGYGSSQTMQGGGGHVRSALERFKDDRTIDVKALTSEQLDRLANSPPRLSTFKDVQAAKYLRAERFLPEDKAKAQPVGKGQERITGALQNTRTVLRDIKRRYGLTINKSEAARASRNARDGEPGALSLENAPDFSNPRWTSSANINNSLDTIATAKTWTVGLEGMREIRSNIRRLLSSKSDTEVNALARADLKRLYSAVSRDMDSLLDRLSDRATQQGNPELAQRYTMAKEAYKDADAFTARYSERLNDVKSLFRVQSDEALAEAIKTAMKDGGKGNMQRIVSLRRILPKETIDELSSSLIVDLGRPTGRASGATQEANFTPSRFASKWNELSPDAKRLVFGHRPELYRSLDRFARISQNISDYEKLVNNSRTGVSNFIWAVVGAGGVGVAQLSPELVLATIGVMTTGNMASRFLASPMYVNWLTRTTSIMKNGGQPGAMQRQMEALRSLVARDEMLDPQAAQAIIMMMDGSSEGQRRP